VRREKGREDERREHIQLQSRYEKNKRGRVKNSERKEGKGLGREKINGWGKVVNQECRCILPKERGGALRRKKYNREERHQERRMIQKGDLN